MVRGKFETREIIRDTFVIKSSFSPPPPSLPLFETFTVENSYENRGTRRKCLTNIQIMVEEAFIFVPWRVIGNWSMRTIGVLLKRALLSIVTSALPSYERRGGVRSLSSSRLDDYRSAKTNYFPRWNARSFPALVSIRTSFHIRVMKITRVPKRERERERWKRQTETPS